MRILLTTVLCLFSGWLSAQGEYAERREALSALLDTTTALAMKGGEEGPDQVTRFRQDRNFLYLTGVSVPGARMILAPRGIRIGSGIKTCFLFADLRQDPVPAVPLTSSDTLLDASRFSDVLGQALSGIHTLCYAPEASFLHDWINGKAYFTDREMRKTFEKAHPGIRLKTAVTLISRLRQVKSPGELDVLRKAIQLTGDGLRRAIEDCRPGMYEYDIQALIEFEAIRQGSTGMGFASIIGSGKNSLIPHYFDNNCELHAGDLIVIDVGAEWQGYSADVTRTIPVSGAFTKEQAVVYRTVLDIQKALIALIRPGVTILDIEREAFELTRAAGYGRNFLHGVTHSIGLDVHDPMNGDTLCPGMVITVEPGIYIPAGDTAFPEGRRGFGIRIEDDVLVTETGSKVLSSEIPKEMAEIEKLMRKD